MFETKNLKYKKIIKQVVEQEVYQLTDNNDILYMIDQSQDFNYQTLIDQELTVSYYTNETIYVSERIFSELWNIAKNFIFDMISDISIKEYNKYIVDSIVEQYSEDLNGLSELLNDIDYDDINYPKEFVMFNSYGIQTDIYHEQYNNNGISIEIY